MDIAVIASSSDPAGVNIRNNLIKLFGFENASKKSGNNDVFFYKTGDKSVRLHLISRHLIFAERIDNEISADAYIFASMHRSSEDTPSLTVHPIGNWGKADFGGQDGKLCFSSAILLKNLFIELNKNAENSSYAVTLEATHHGPYVGKPAAFVEIGSTEKEWNDALSGEITAKTIVGALKSQHQDYKSCILIGGGHYNKAANKLMLKTDYAVGHICPKYALGHLDEELLMQAINKTVPKPEIVLVDWKGLGEYKQKIMALLKSLNVKCERVQNILRETSN